MTDEEIDAAVHLGTSAIDGVWLERGTAGAEEAAARADMESVERLGEFAKTMRDRVAQLEGQHAMTYEDLVAAITRRTQHTRLEKSLDELMTQTRRSLALALLVAREHAAHPYITRLERENATLREIVRAMVALEEEVVSGDDTFFKGYSSDEIDPLREQARALLLP